MMCATLAAGTILVVDDTPANLTLLVETLRAAGYRALPADSGELALAAVAAQVPDLILLDIRMPGLGGFDVCRRLKARPASRDVPILFISAFGDGAERAEGFALGAVDFISKPFQQEELLARVRTHLELHRLRVYAEHQAADLRRVNESLRAELVEHARAEDERCRSEAQLEQAFGASPIGMALVALDGSILRLNRAFCATLGLTEAELLAAGLQAITHPDVLSRDEQFMRELIDGERPDFEMEKRFVTDGHPTVVHLNVSLVFDAHGLPLHFVAHAQDITARTQAESATAALEAQLQDAKKMESVGRLAGGIAHDFNNMLGVILGNTELVMAQVDAAHPLRADLLEIQKAAQRSADLTRQLLAYARKQTIAPVVLDLNDCVAGLLSMLRRLIGEDVLLAWRPAATLWPVSMDPSQMANILTNLCLNARDAITDVGTIAIATANQVVDSAFCATHVDAVPGEYVQLSVRDTGSGMDEAMRAQIFEPFFTTKGVGEGTGLGLASVYGAIKQNRGFITVCSEVGCGTTFEIYLPRQVVEGKAPRKSGAVRLAAGHETILLVEDEPAVLLLTKRVLKAKGYAVLAAGSPPEAIRLARQHAGEIHLLLTDVVMPEMNGRELAKAITAIRPQIKQLFMSGHPAEVIASRGMLELGMAFIEKPYPIGALIAKVRETLDDDVLYAAPAD